MFRGKSFSIDGAQLSNDHDNNVVIPTSYTAAGSQPEKYTNGVNGANGATSAHNVDDPDYVEGETDFSKDENEDRGNWSGKLDFLLACLGYAVGLGNVWRFPYYAYKNGGAVFFIPYVIMLTFVGMPIFFMELSLGQFTSASPLTCWNMAPFFKGIGVGMMCVSAMVGIYYNMIIAWSIWYLFATLVNITDLPWQYCDGYFNTEYCSLRLSNVTMDTCMGPDLSLRDVDNGVCYNITADPANETFWVPYGIHNDSLALDNGIKSILPSEEYLNGRALGKSESEGIGDLGPLRWELVLALLAAWLIVFFSLIKGVKSSGKVVYFTALFPYAVLVILLIRGVTLDGHFLGIEFYILKVDFEKLQNAQVWKDAAVQIFFSLSASWGGLITLASYNRFHTNTLRDSLIVTIGNCLTSVFAGFVIFSFLGFLATELGKPVSEVAEQGVGLAFVVYPDAVTRMPVSALWAILFFIMLITLGLDSEFALVETVFSCLCDQFPVLRKKKWLVLLCISTVGFLLGLPLCTNGGAFVLQLMDHYCGSWNLLILAVLECICIAMVYGFTRYREDIRIMIGSKPLCCLPWTGISMWWGINWCFFTPVGVLFVLGFSLYDYTEVTYGDYKYPAWADGLGLAITLAVVVVGPVCTGIASLVIALRKGKPLLSVFRPNKYWGPALVKHRKLVLNYVDEDKFIVDPWSDDVALNDIPVTIPSEPTSAYANPAFG